MLAALAALAEPAGAAGAPAPPSAWLAERLTVAPTNEAVPALKKPPPALAGRATDAAGTPCPVPPHAPASAPAALAAAATAAVTAPPAAAVGLVPRERAGWRCLAALRRDRGRGALVVEQPPAIAGAAGPAAAPATGLAGDGKPA